MEQNKFDLLVDLCHASKEAHGAAFADSGGDDLDWPAWYAGFMQPRLEELLEVRFAPGELAAHLIQVDQEQRANAPGDNWTAYYASYFLERYGS